MVISSARCFSAAVGRIIKGYPRGCQRTLAEKIRISPQYINDMIAGRKLWPDEHKDSIAQSLGFSVSELLQIGQIIIETGQFFPYIKDVAALTPHSEDRADWIMRRAGRDEGLGDVRFLVSAAVKLWAYGLIEPYLAGKETDAELYERTRLICRRIMNKDNR